MMIINAALTFEVLLYLNSYYFGLFAVCEIGVNIVKEINLTLPNFATEFGILSAVCVLELFRVVLARKGNLTEKGEKTTLLLSFLNIAFNLFLIWKDI